jgi:hypothetical protein
MKDKQHVFLESRIGLENLSSKQLEDFEFIIGTLNETLESMYGCTIFYDTDSDDQLADKNINVSGFLIQVLEDDEAVT